MTWCNVSMHNAVATSAALGLPIALAGTFSNIYYGMGTPGLSPGSLGFVYLPALLVIAIASITTAPLGAKTAHSLPVKSLITLAVAGASLTLVPGVMPRLLEIGDSLGRQAFR